MGLIESDRQILLKERHLNYSTTPVHFEKEDSGSFVTNGGSSSAIDFYLPQISTITPSRLNSGLYYRFSVLSPYDLKIMTQGSDVLYLASSSGETSSYTLLRSAILGSTICVESYTDDKWIIVSITGKWTDV